MDVIVVGAGAAGLTAAREMQRAGLRVLVLEARNRLGGRIHTLRYAGHPPLELGAEFLHGLHPLIARERLRIADCDGKPLLREVARSCAQGFFACDPERWLDGADAVDWSKDAWARGAYCVVPVGLTDTFAHLGDPLEHTLYFAGEATDPYAGTVHGAMHSGARAAEQLLAERAARRRRAA